MVFDMIKATLHSNHTEFKAEFDATEGLLGLSHETLKALCDGDEIANRLAPESLINQARLDFYKTYGNAFSDMSFNFWVEVKEEVIKFLEEDDSRSFSQSRALNDEAVGHAF